MNGLSSATPLLQVLPLERGRGLRLIGELDLSTVDDLRMMLERLPVDGHGVTLDLADLSFMDSTGLHLFETYARTLDGARPLVLDHVPERIRKLFEITGLDDHPLIEVRGGGDHG